MPLIARHMLSRETIQASQASTILGHALVGKAEDCLSALVHSVMMADQETLALLAEHFFLLRILSTDAPVYPKNSALFGMMRLVQFRLVAAAGKDAAIATCAAALLRAIATGPDVQARRHFEAVVLSTVLVNMDSANYLPGWLSLLSGFRTLVEIEEDLRELKANVELTPGCDGLNLYDMLFAIGATRISSVERFGQIIDLDGFQADERAMWLQSYHATSASSVGSSTGRGRRNTSATRLSRPTPRMAAA